MTSVPWAAGAALVAAAGLAAGPAAAKPVSSKFDGIYKGSRYLVEPLSGETCEAPKRYSVEIKNGVIDGEALPVANEDRVAYSINGIVTSDGFFTGTHEAETVERTLIQGRVDESMMVGGLLTQGENCAWIVKLEKA